MKRNIFIFIWVLIALAIITIPSYSQNGSWTNPILISSIGQTSWFPDIATDKQGRIHVVWSSNTTGYDLVIYTTSVDGVNWQTPTDIFALQQSTIGNVAVTRPAIFIDKDNIFHITYRELSVLYSKTTPEKAGLASSWNIPTQLSGQYLAYFSKIAEDSKGILHAVYTEQSINSSCTECYHLFYRRSSNQGIDWSDPLDISMNNGAVKPQVVIDSQDNIYVIWESGIGGGLGQLDITKPTNVYFIASSNGGDSWSSPYQLNPTVNLAKNPAMGIDKNNQLIVTWIGCPIDSLEGKYYYQVSKDKGVSWSSPQPMAEIEGTYPIVDGRTDAASIASDMDGNLHIVLIGRNQKDLNALSVIHLTWDGSMWSLPENIDTIIGDVPEWPRIAIDYNNNLHVVWFVRDQLHLFNHTANDTPPDYRILYSVKIIKPINLENIEIVKTPTTLLKPSTTTKQLTNDSTSQTVELTNNAVSIKETLNINTEVVETETPTVFPYILAPSPTLQFPALELVFGKEQIVYKEMDYIKIVTVSLLPSLLIVVGIVIIIHYIRKR